MSDNRARVFFGNELRRMREHGGLTGKQLADALGCTPQWISTMESGRKVSEQSAHDLDTYFRTDGIFHRLWKLASEIEIEPVLPPSFAEYSAREKRADSIRVYNALILSGLFQTEDYARSVFRDVDQTTAEDFICKRMERREILFKENAPRVWLTLDESVLHRVIGDREITREQFAYLLECSRRPNVFLNIVPWSAGYHAGLAGSFTILGFNDGTNVAYTESAGEGMLFENPVRVTSYVVRYELLKAYALPVEESRALISTVLESL
ncbi:helix-turn-helix transcriptional regulator [Actinomadura luteofluorescens]|uniref:helix-turn-helix domain-containing protein n=1 Tax=Actinomadura luteofluorescens TaxID=46163 RepID=UPI00216434C1|nr:helix-turn-helix transcriptional regulator [Actinomadura glauciflava]MCR3741092.1 Transcriptional regulator, contains XRE-family HTH domain [Actinomadura glauciflava]